MSRLNARQIQWIIAFQVIVLLQIVFSDWGLSDSCGNYKECRRKPKEVTSTNQYGLWPGLTSTSDLENGEVIFGFDEVTTV